VISFATLEVSSSLYGVGGNPIYTKYNNNNNNNNKKRERERENETA